MVRVEGLEPPRLAAPEPKSGASTNSATPAWSARLSKAFSGMREEKRRHPNFLESTSCLKLSEHLWQHLGQVLGN